MIQNYFCYYCQVINLHVANSSSASFPAFYVGSMFLMRYLHHHHSLAHISDSYNFYSSQCMPIPLQPTFLHFLGYFSHLHCPSISFIPNSVQLGDSTHFYHIQLLLFFRIRSLTQSVGAMLWSIAQLRRGQLRMVLYVVGSC